MRCESKKAVQRIDTFWVMLGTLVAFEWRFRLYSKKAGPSSTELLRLLDALLGVPMRWPSKMALSAAVAVRRLFVSN